MTVRDFPAARAAIFDMDGLLVDTEPYWRSVEVDVFAQLGVDITPLLGRGLTMGMRVDEVVAFFRARLGWEGPSDDEVAERIVAGIVTAIRDRAELLPGAIESVDLLAGYGLRVALASGSTPPVIDAVLERFGLAGRFSVVSSAVDDRLGKPHPAIFLRTAAALGVDAIECVVLEDSLNGCVAAKAARMRVVAVPDRRFADDGRFAIADVRLSSLEQLGESEVIALLGLEPARS
ncbi:MAG TPA: hexitol phosphatase HxpB [Acidimicrobiales bacterium]|nr:hexitol phosphatase HxpB [Acidimicrobiales bacterium]